MTDRTHYVEVGQRYTVVSTSVFEIGPRVGDKGTLLAIDDLPSGNLRLRIRWDNFRTGHSCDGLCKQGHGWNFLDSEIGKHIELIEDVVNQIDLSCMEGLL